MFKKCITLVLCLVAVSEESIPSQHPSYPSLIESSSYAVKTNKETYDAYPKYSYSYDVRSGDTADIKSQIEIRDGDVTHGEYSLIDADGYRRRVRYVVNGKSGFNAIVDREPLSGKAGELLALKTGYGTPKPNVPITSHVASATDDIFIPRPSVEHSLSPEYTLPNQHATTSMYNHDQTRGRATNYASPTSDISAATLTKGYIYGPLRNSNTAITGTSISYNAYAATDGASHSSEPNKLNGPTALGVVVPNDEGFQHSTVGQSSLILPTYKDDISSTAIPYVTPVSNFAPSIHSNTAQYQGATLVIAPARPESASAVRSPYSYNAPNSYRNIRPVTNLPQRDSNYPRLPLGDVNLHIHKPMYA